MKPGLSRDLCDGWIKAAKQMAGTQHASRARHPELGAMSQFSAKHFREHFEEEARGTLAEGRSWR